ncbi:MAG: hypothetical protein QNK37_23085 [Acidobacteriota bacterium]|nr:hypothetical protein [Acidobacteriota bacterium]
MKIESLKVAVRPREFWEAMDLGLMMTRRWCTAVYPPWLVLVTLVWGTLALIFHRAPGWALFFFWWSKPLLARLPLFVLSRAMFDTPPSLMQTLKAYPGQLRFAWLSRMTIFRLSPNRGVLEPVLMLEGQKGKPRARRMRFLAGELVGQSFFLTFLFLLCELFVVFTGLWIFSMQLLPQEFAHLLPTDPGTTAGMFVWSLFYFLTVALLEPFFVGAAFGLYLNTRTILEGWDVELTFKGLAARLAKTTVLVTACLLFPAFSPPAHAQDESPAQQLEEKDDRLLTQEAVKRIKDSPSYSRGEKKSKVWRLRDFGDDKQRNQRNLRGFQALGQIAGYLMYLVAGLLVLTLLYFLVRALGKGAPAATMKDDRSLDPAPVNSLEALIEPETMPDDIPGAAMQAWRDGEHRRALSYLYRGALLGFHESGRLNIAACATESECLAQVRNAGDDGLYAFFQQLTLAWQSVAWAHRTPSTQTFEKLHAAWLKHMAVTV